MMAWCLPIWTFPTFIVLSSPLNVLVREDDSLSVFLLGRLGVNVRGLRGEVAKALKPYGLESFAEQLPAYWGEQPYIISAGIRYRGHDSKLRPFDLIDD